MTPRIAAQGGIGREGGMATPAPGARCAGRAPAGGSWARTAAGAPCGDTRPRASGLSML